MEAISINYSAVFLAALSAIILGWVWYSPWFFGNYFPKSDKKASVEAAARNQTLFVIAWLVAVYVLSWVVGYLKVFTVDNAIVLGLWLSLGFVWGLQFPSFVTEKRSFRYYFIHSSYSSLGLILACIILAVWR